MKLRIQTSLALFFLTIMILSLPVFLFLSLRISTQMIDRQVRHQLESEALESVQYIEIILKPVENVISRLAENYTLQSFLRAQNHLKRTDLKPEQIAALREDEEIFRWGALDEFRRLLELNPEFERVVYVDLKGTIQLEESGENGQPLRDSIQSISERALKSERGHPVIEDRVLKDGLLRYAIPVIRDENVGVEDGFMQPALALLGKPVRELEGILILDYRFSSLENRILSARVIGTGRGAFFLMDAKGHLLAAPTRYQALLADLFNDWQSQQKGQVIPTKYSWRDQEYLISLWPYTERRWYVGIVAPESDFTFYLEQASRKLIITSIILFSLALLVALILIHRISVPLQNFVVLARQIAMGNFTARVGTQGGKEIFHLASAFNDMAAQLEEYVEEVRKKEQMEGELKVAHNIQAGLLPTQVPQVPGFSVDGRTIPAREVGGDYYDFIPNGQNTLGMAIADVTGRGVPAALVMSMVRTLLRGQAYHGTPQEVLSIINNLVHQDVRGSCHSVAMFFGVLDCENRILRFANAGQMFPLWYRRKINQWQYIELGGIPLGIRPKVDYRLGEIQMEPGDRIVFYTDGLVESSKIDGEIFGFHRFETLMETIVDLPPKEAIDKILDQLYTFTGHDEPDDDLTLAILEAVGHDES